MLSELSELRAVDVVLAIKDGTGIRSRCVTERGAHGAELHGTGLNLAPTERELHATGLNLAPTERSSMVRGCTGLLRFDTPFFAHLY